MIQHAVPGLRFDPRRWAWAIASMFVWLLALTPAATAAPSGPLGRIQGKIVAADTGDPLGFADVLLIPADTTMRRVGGLTNADGTFLLEAAPGKYTLQIRARVRLDRLGQGSRRPDSERPPRRAYNR